MSQKVIIYKAEAVVDARLNHVIYIVHTRFHKDGFCYEDNTGFLEIRLGRRRGIE